MPVVLWLLGVPLSTYFFLCCLEWSISNRVTRHEQNFALVPRIIISPHRVVCSGEGKPEEIQREKTARQMT